MATRSVGAIEFSGVSPHYVQKAERKNRTKDEVVEDIADPVMRNVRYLDKLIDELAKGKPMAKILRRPA